MNTQEMYDAVPEPIKDHVTYAARWAENKLIRHEGEGHLINVTADGCSGMVVCCFSKPEWKADHCGSQMETASEAIVMAVCEYLATSR